MRKTGAYRVYTQSNYNIGLVMHLLNHSSEAMTLAYLGLDQASQEMMPDQIFSLFVMKSCSIRRHKFRNGIKLSSFCFLFFTLIINIVIVKNQLKI